MLPVKPLQIMAKQCDLELTPRVLRQFEQYTELLLDWNTRLNLTAITEPEEIAVKHFADSISLLGTAEIPMAAKVIDVGTGAGFPGIPLKILRPDIELTLLDALSKRIRFLQAVGEALELDYHTVHGRAEEAGRNPAMREQYDLAAARAVAGLPVLCEFCLPFVRTGGLFIAMKGPRAAEETDQAANAIETLGGELREMTGVKLPDDSKRTLIFIQKRMQTPTKYPRPFAKIQKSPL